MPKPPDLTITLFVNYQAVYDAEHNGPPVSDSNPCCNFGQPATQKNKDYTSRVNKGSTILWKGQAIAGSYTGSIAPLVNIFAIFTDNGNDVFSDIDINGTPKTTTGTVVTTLGRDMQPDEPYSVWFNIHEPNAYTSNCYRVDPQIKVNP